LEPEFFGEGICRVADRIWQLTWRERIALSWDAETLEPRENVRYNREGWGMCAVGQAPVEGAAPLPDVITSDGTSELVRRDPVTLEPGEVLQVRCQGQRVRGLNDLTWAGGLVWANVAGTDCLAGIDLETSEVTDVVDAGAAAERVWRDPQAIMNGIAAVGAPGEFLLTGKGWRSIRQARLVPDRDRGHVKRLLAGWSRLSAGATGPRPDAQVAEFRAGQRSGRSRYPPSASPASRSNGFHAPTSPDSSQDTPAAAK
jgi:glutaminyl-peptide cyclotransferase